MSKEHYLGPWKIPYEHNTACGVKSKNITGCDCCVTCLRCKKTREFRKVADGK